LKVVKYHPPGGLKHAGSGAKGTVLALALAALGALVVGCVPTTVHPLYRVGDLVQDPNLLGVWRTPDDKGRWTFTSGEGKNYTLEIQVDDQRVVCVAHLFRLGEERFLDLYPAGQELGATLHKNPYSIGLIPAHAFLRVQATNPKLRMSCMGLDWLKERLKLDPQAVAHVMLPNGGVALTGGTEVLQAFVMEHINNADAWNVMYEDGLVRVLAKPAVR